MDTVALIRDLVIIVYAGVSVLVVVVVFVIALLLYRKVSPILDSVKETSKQAQEVTTLLKDKVAKPLSGAAGPSYTVGRLVAFVLGLSRGKGGRKDGK